MILRAKECICAHILYILPAQLTCGSSHRVPGCHSASGARWNIGADFEPRQWTRLWTRVCLWFPEMWVIVGVTLSTKGCGQLVNVLPLSGNFYIHISKRPPRSEQKAGDFWHQWVTRPQGNNFYPKSGSCEIQGPSLLHSKTRCWPVLVSFCLSPEQGKSPSMTRTCLLWSLNVLTLLHLLPSHTPTW